MVAYTKVRIKSDSLIVQEIELAVMQTNPRQASLSLTEQCLQAVEALPCLIVRFAVFYRILLLPSLKLHDPEDGALQPEVQLLAPRPL